jgi:hypothetical protein
MDNFLDVIIVRKKKGLYSLLYFLASLFMIGFGLLAAMNVFSIIGQSEDSGISINFMSLIIFVVAGGLTFLLYWSRALIKIDYDISFTNGFVEIARVANNIRRKELCRFYMKEVEAGGYASTPGFKRYDSMKDIKRYKAVLNSDAEVFYVFVVVKDSKALVTFEANQELIELMHKYNPRTVKLAK